MKNNPRLRLWLRIAGIVLTLTLLIAFWNVVEQYWLHSQYLGQRESFELWSESVGDSFVIRVCLPRHYDDDCIYPVIYVLDGDIDAIPMAGAAANQRLDVIVVGIGYGGDEGNARERDYTPFVAPEIDWAPTGGGEAFYNFLVDELIPEIDTRYPTMGEGHRVLAGNGLAGLATVYALLRSPEEHPPFYGYIAVSPPLPLADRAIFDIELAMADERSRLGGVVLLSMGARESDEMKRAMGDLAATFRYRPYSQPILFANAYSWPSRGGTKWQAYLTGARAMYEYGVLSSEDW